MTRLTAASNCTPSLLPRKGTPALATIDPVLLNQEIAPVQAFVGAGSGSRQIGFARICPQTCRSSPGRICSECRRQQRKQAHLFRVGRPTAQRSSLPLITSDQVKYLSGRSGWRQPPTLDRFKAGLPEQPRRQLRDLHNEPSLIAARQHEPYRKRQWSKICALSSTDMRQTKK